MADLKDKKDSDYLFMQEKIKQKPIYQNRTVRKCASCILSGILFALAALGLNLLLLRACRHRTAGAAAACGRAF